MRGNAKVGDPPEVSKLWLTFATDRTNGYGTFAHNQLVVRPLHVTGNEMPSIDTYRRHSKVRSYTSRSREDHRSWSSRLPDISWPKTYYNDPLHIKSRELCDQKLARTVVPGDESWNIWMSSQPPPFHRSGTRTRSQLERRDSRSSTRKPSSRENVSDSWEAEVTYIGDVPVHKPKHSFSVRGSRDPFGSLFNSRP